MEEGETPWPGEIERDDPDRAAGWAEAAARELDLAGEGDEASRGPTAHLHRPAVVFGR